jgi:hypothetical protein
MRSSHSCAKSAIAPRRKRGIFRPQFSDTKTIMRLPRPLLAITAALAMTTVCAAASDAAGKPADKATPTKPAASELTVDLKVKGMT